MSDFRGNMAAASWEGFSIEQILCTPSRLSWRGLAACLFAQGAGSIAPGDIAVENRTILEADMVFVVHPNQ